MGGICEFFEVLVGGGLTIALAAVAYIVLLNVFGGERLSWDVVDQAIDQLIGVASPWLGICG